MEEKFIEIYDKYKNDVFRIAFSYTKSISDAEDITQNVFIKLFNNFDGLKNQDYLKKWLIKVTINEAKSILLSSWKKKIRLTQINDENLHKTEFKIDETIEDILKLPKKERLIIHLYYYEGYSVKEIAEIIHISEANVKITLFRARKKLKEELV